MKSKCAILIPAYRSLTPLEAYFLKNNTNLLLNHEIILILPSDFVIDNSFHGIIWHKKLYFDKDYFLNTRTYNKLMLSSDFYECFEDYEYILIVQADVFVFEDQVEYWCNKNFDYIGAPWFRYNKLNKGKLFWYFYKNIYRWYLGLSRKSGWLYNRVGNGGFSLRKVETFLNILKKSPEHILDCYLNSKDDSYNEDVFWSIEAPKISRSFNIPKFKEALHFAIEQDPENAYYYIGEKLPFGCHDAIRQNKNFWSKFIEF